MSGITTHVLDLSTGRPAGGVPVTLECRAGDAWVPVNSADTNDDGRAVMIADGEAMSAGEHRLVFETGLYFDGSGVDHFHPRVRIEFTISDDGADAREHYHVPLLLSPFGYSTYRGS